MHKVGSTILSNKADYNILTLKSSFCSSVAGVSRWARNALQVGIFLGMRASVHLTVNQSGL